MGATRELNRKLITAKRLWLRLLDEKRWPAPAVNETPEISAGSARKGPAGPTRSGGLVDLDIEVTRWLRAQVGYISSIGGILDHIWGLGAGYTRDEMAHILWVLDVVISWISLEMDGVAAPEAELLRADQIAQLFAAAGVLVTPAEIEQLAADGRIRQHRIFDHRLFSISEVRAVATDPSLWLN